MTQTGCPLCGSTSYYTIAGVVARSELAGDDCHDPQCPIGHPDARRQLSDVEWIGRQILGHAYPDKTFDELTEEEIERVRYQLKWADETLAEIMPIVAKEES